MKMTETMNIAFGNKTIFEWDYGKKYLGYNNI